MGGGGVDGGATMTTKSGGGAGDSAAASSNVSKMDTSANQYIKPLRYSHPHLPWPTQALVASDWSYFLQQMHINGTTLSYKRGGPRKSRGLYPTINQAVGGCIHHPGATQPQSRQCEIRLWARLFFYANVPRYTLSLLAREKHRKWMGIHTQNTKMNM